CVQFSDMAEETLSGVFAEVANALVVFSTDEDIRYAFGDNRRKISPKMLEDGHSIYLGIREEKLSAYYTVLQLILNQTLGELEKRSEDAEPILFLIDELPRILSVGKLEKLLDSSRTLRSRRVRLMLVTQSMEALMAAYSENETMDLMSNCAYKIILDASSSKTQKMVCEWAGKYKERKLSVSDGGSKRRNTTSYEEKDILLPSDLMTLAKTGELILISPHGYNRIQKCMYYKDPYFKGLGEEIRQHNETINEILLQRE
ncbi:MAG: type IV secretory system conjugative DNA transfer family protein, partial [Eubacteriales bacterium]|nr:type IV secretory system conjugative DNA transfer family protein [Eubacteriales bacterium]